MDWLIQGFKAKTGIDLAKNAMALQRIKDEAENAKKQLSQTDSVDINIPFITTSEGNPQHIQETLTRAQFEKICADLFDRCKKPVQAALADSKLKTSDISEIILVG